ncbi:SpoIIE family protein phosphatase [Colwellia sp. RSH04]|uniref:ATP-binding SpoIIE family protein phosphatase n=1 Tax=Colwellia sp. RSH04 TaxID=2305464 RepID=UPI000E567A7E|nr:SpoIIE family protein phosphatase [Colwellia sp. RSH04]RHW77094.1 response regulator [Colwellia sp. RSH04]
MFSIERLALIVDDSKTQCLVLSKLLEEENYTVIVANDGASGVQKYIKHKPDLVLMDINMPIMNGFEAARQIKNLSGTNDLAPLIFITSMNTDQAYIDSVDSGGDGILVRPFSPAVFKAKIKSIQRISNLYQQVKSLQQEQQQDAELAEKMMSEVIESRNYALDRVQVIKKPATIFSGDIQLTALCPNGDIHVLLGDFTGHGLRSSIGAIPVTETFRAMTKKGFSVIDIIAQLNKQLNQLLPADLFFAAGIVCISEHEKSAYIFNAGLPDGYLFNNKGKIKKQFESTHPPLGILPDLLPDAKVELINIDLSDHVVFISDGIIEARNEQGELFGVERFEHAATEGIAENNLVSNVEQYLATFCRGVPQEDDISLVAAPCNNWLKKVVSNRASIPEEIYQEEFNDKSIPAWSWQLKLSGKLLKNVNPIPMIMNQINDIEGAGEHWHSLYTILTELFVNSLDHGVLGLSSSLKQSAEGFSQFFHEKAHRLEKLDSGYVMISLKYFPFTGGGRMEINIKDSGKGFDIKQVMQKNQSKSMDSGALSGRGIELVKQLCDSLTFVEDGTSVIANFVWQINQ